MRLRPLLREDAARIHEWASQPTACRFQPWGPNSPAETEVFVDGAVAAWEQGPQMRWVWAAAAADTVVGIGEVQRKEVDAAEISYAVHIDLWGRGIATCIGRLLVAWALENLDVGRITATCDPRNVASEHVLRGLGMQLERTESHSLMLRDGWRDSYVFSLARREWSARMEE
ncbi:hypothetical protein AX769_12435 [Frondihabitans sp. PAMC 28766]|nr:hypothetical protein AX769_12435 [Frondihabitans sp. PAMC 28766]